jgi:hypothetical protein
MNDASASHINANQGTMKAANTSKLGQQIKINQLGAHLTASWAALSREGDCSL